MRLKSGRQKVSIWSVIKEISDHQYCTNRGCGSFRPQAWDTLTSLPCTLITLILSWDRSLGYATVSVNVHAQWNVCVCIHHFFLIFCTFQGRAFLTVEQASQLFRILPPIPLWVTYFNQDVEETYIAAYIFTIAYVLSKVSTYHIHMWYIIQWYLTRLTAYSKYVCQMLL